MYLNVYKTDEVKQIIFLLNFRNEILVDSLFNEDRGALFLEFATKVK
jgi:hypothetical protein